jgi:hypothetical protein
MAFSEPDIETYVTKSDISKGKNSSETRIIPGRAHEPCGPPHQHTSEQVHFQ